VHKIDVQQGNVVTQEMVGQLRLGMNPKKVRYVMGSPIIQDTFHSNRWDYIYTYHVGGGGTERRLVTVVFNDDDKLIGVEGDVKAALGRLEVDRHQDTSVQVPAGDSGGLFSKLHISMPFTGDDEDEDAEVAAEVEDEVEQSDDDHESLIADAEVESVTVPEGAPPQKKKGLIQRLVDAVGLGAEDEDEEDEEGEYDPGDPKYRDPTAPDVHHKGGPQ
jgi:outer membrane protein assembly factor BamE